MKLLISIIDLFSRTPQEQRGVQALWKSPWNSSQPHQVRVQWMCNIILTISIWSHATKLADYKTMVCCWILHLIQGGCLKFNINFLKISYSALTFLLFSHLSPSILYIPCFSPFPPPFHFDTFCLSGWGKKLSGLLFFALQHFVCELSRTIMFKFTRAVVLLVQLLNTLLP